MSILFVFTSANLSLTDDSIGWYLPEAAHPYFVLSPHFTIEFASPKGPNPPIDPSSFRKFKGDEECAKFLNDKTVLFLLEHAKRLEAVNWKDYVALFYIGGRGPVMDLPENKANIQLANDFYQSGRLVSAVCHGPAALVKVKDADGKSIFDGKTVTGFSNAEEKEVGNLEGLPFMIETRIRDLGGKYVKADEKWAPKVVHSGNLLTGQNPASSKLLAEEILNKLRANVGN